ncbi:MAG: lipolytic protein family [Verrucomicrobia bacterium]|nr:lipolytic protein family [Verrucomicrobiota bacterium]
MSENNPAADLRPLVPPMSNPAEPAYVPPVEVAGLPRVLLLGDSISIGYTMPVRARLLDVANVRRPADNCGQTAYALLHLREWLGETKWDVIHFNFGLHDIKYLDAAGNYVSPDQGRQVAPPPLYRANLERLVALLEATGARLVFATTTPVPEGAAGRVAGAELRYNQVAADLMASRGVKVNDLWACATKCREEFMMPCDVHFTPAGYQELAEWVAASIRAEL